MPRRPEAGSGRRRGGKSMAASAVAVASGTPAGLAWKKRAEPHQQPAPPAPTQPKQTPDTASAAATQPPKALDVAVVPCRAPLRDLTNLFSASCFGIEDFQRGGIHAQVTMWLEAIDTHWVIE